MPRDPTGQAAARIGAPLIRLFAFAKLAKSDKSKGSSTQDDGRDRVIAKFVFDLGAGYPPERDSTCNIGLR
jgi:hypothetical protein